jgi:hypothetical protein
MRAYVLRILPVFAITIPAVGLLVRYPQGPADLASAVATHWWEEANVPSPCARICSSVAAVTKLPSTRICHPPPSARGEAERDIGQYGGEAALRLEKILLRGQHGGK